MAYRGALGIDLGTTNSAVASIDGSAGVVVLRNANGAELTPSVVYFENDGTVLIGEEARTATAYDPDNGVALIKRYMGTDFPISVGDNTHTPESISALILKYLVFSAHGALGSRRTRAVITVPAYFGLAEKEATHQAGLIAGLDVLELLAEPVAAAAAYGLSSHSNTTVLVYDLGGGTFDTTVLRITGGGSIEVLATDGHHELGGADVNTRLLHIVLDRVESKLSDDQFVAFSDDEASLGAAALEIEAAKLDLSSRMSRDIFVRTSAGTIGVTLTRQDVETACADLLQATDSIVDRVLNSSRGADIGGVDEVLLVGGSSRLPSVIERLEQRLGVRPRLFEPDLAIAKGAALRAHQLLEATHAGAPGAIAKLGYSGIASGNLVGVLPRAVGILVEDSYDPAGERKFVQHLIGANTPLPVSHVERGFGTIIDSQESVRIQVYEQAGSVASENVDDNRRVLDGELTGLPDLPAGSIIQVTIDIENGGRLRVVAHEPRSGIELILESFMEGVVDSVETQRLTSLVAGITVKG
jgi:molecular chaperone DnaK (HSP70)